METALIGLLGVLIGLLANEYFRRGRRIESYSSRVFDKRIQIYEKLYQKVSDCSSIISEVTENPDYSKEERKEIISNAILELAEFGDENDFYLHEYIVLQYMTLLMGVEDIFDIQDKKKREQEVQRVWKHLRETKRMIRKESGLEELDKLFRSITRAKHKSALIEYFDESKREQRKKERKNRA
jgi:hypothetical protein